MNLEESKEKGIFKDFLILSISLMCYKIKKKTLAAGNFQIYHLVLR